MRRRSILFVMLASLLASGVVLMPRAEAVTETCHADAGLSAGVPTAVPGVDPFTAHRIAPVPLPPEAEAVVLTGQSASYLLQTGPSCRLNISGDEVRVNLAASTVGVVTTEISAFVTRFMPGFPPQTTFERSVCGPAVNKCHDSAIFSGFVSGVRCAITGMASVTASLTCTATAL